MYSPKDWASKNTETIIWLDLFLILRLMAVEKPRQLSQPRINSHTCTLELPGTHLVVHQCSITKHKKKESTTHIIVPQNTEISTRVPGGRQNQVTDSERYSDTSLGRKHIFLKRPMIAHVVIMPQVRVCTCSPISRWGWDKPAPQGCIFTAAS